MPYSKQKANRHFLKGEKNTSGLKQKMVWEGDVWTYDVRRYWAVDFVVIERIPTNNNAYYLTLGAHRINPTSIISREYIQEIRLLPRLGVNLIPWIKGVAISTSLCCGANSYKNIRTPIISTLRTQALKPDGAPSMGYRISWHKIHNNRQKSAITTNIKVTK